MNSWFLSAYSAVNRLLRRPLYEWLRRYPPHDELWLQERGSGPRPADWLGIFGEC